METKLYVLQNETEVNEQICFSVPGVKHTYKQGIILFIQKTASQCVIRNYT